jgi:2'-5' RNA ligase
MPGMWISRSVALLLFGVLAGCDSRGMSNIRSTSDMEPPVTAIDIALEPDPTMVDRADRANARLRGVYPDGFALDAVHHPHITLLQRFVKTADLENVYAATNSVFNGEKLTTWRLKAFKYYYVPSPPHGVAGIVIKPTEALVTLQQRLIDAVAPFTAKTATVTAFASTEQGRDIQGSLIEYVATFVPDRSGPNFNPHVTVGVGTQPYLDAMLAEPFTGFEFSPAGASVYQLGSYGTAQNKLHSVALHG